MIPWYIDAFVLSAVLFLRHRLAERFSDIPRNSVRYAISPRGTRTACSAGKLTSRSFSPVSFLVDASDLLFPFSPAPVVPVMVGPAVLLLFVSVFCFLAISFRFQPGRETVRVVQRPQRASAVFRASDDLHPREERHKRNGLRCAEHTAGWLVRSMIPW